VRFNAGDWQAIVTSQARVAGKVEPNGLPSCRACGGDIRNADVVHRLIPRTGGEHVYVHALCWP